MKIDPDAIKTSAARARQSGVSALYHLKMATQESGARNGLRRRHLPAATLALGGAAGMAPAWAQRAATPVPAAAPARAITWPAADAVLAARHQRAFAGLARRIGAQLTDVQSVVAVHRGHLAFEYYRSGLSADSLQDTQSVTKSVLALLFGCALADGKLRSTRELVAQRLPELLRIGADPRVQKLRFEHLLTMTAGWAGEQTARRDRDDDLRRIARRPFVAEPGARFAYDNGAANLLALALANTLGQPLSNYARTRLFAPLGIDRFTWRQGLSLSARAMARVGELALAEGRWAGRAVLPADFVRSATERQNAGGDPLFTAYGYLWWVASTAPSRRAERRTAMANGYGGQWIYVYPPLDLVVAATSRRTPESMARGQAGTLIRRDILPALQRA